MKGWGMCGYGGFSDSSNQSLSIFLNIAIQAKYEPSFQVYCFHSATRIAETLNRTPASLTAHVQSGAQVPGFEFQPHHSLSV